MTTLGSTSRWWLRPVRRLRGRPGALAVVKGAGPVYVLANTGPDGLLQAVDRDGRVRWRTGVGKAFGQIRVAADGGVWLAGEEGDCLREVRPDGSSGRRVVPASPGGERIAAFLVLADGFVIAWTRHSPDGVRVERTDRHGTRLWSTSPEITPVSYSGVIEMRRDTGWRPVPCPAWTPSLRPLGGGPTPLGNGTLLMSGDRLLVGYEDVRSGLAVSWCLDLDTGRLVWSPPPRPSGQRASAAGGRFLIGANGYGAFETRLYDRDGTELAHWPSHGALLVSSRGRFRVLERDHDASRRPRARRLHRDGSLGEGTPLPGGDPASPVLSSDGRAVFWHHGALHTIDAHFRLRVHCKGPKRTGADRMLLLDDGTLAFVVTDEDGDGDGGELLLADTDLAPLDTGPWPCGEGTLRATP